MFRLDRIAIFTSRLHLQLHRAAVLQLFSSSSSIETNNVNRTGPPPICVSLTESAGRGVFATRRIGAGDLIHTAKPFVSYPSMSTIHSVCYFCLRKLGESEHSRDAQFASFCNVECAEQSKVTPFGLIFDSCYILPWIVVVRLRNSAMHNSCLIFCQTELYLLCYSMFLQFVVISPVWSLTSLLVYIRRLRLSVRLRQEQIGRPLMNIVGMEVSVVMLYLFTSLMALLFQIVIPIFVNFGCWLVHYVYWALWISTKYNQQSICKRKLQWYNVKKVEIFCYLLKKQVAMP